jgi:hypothetical protein
MSAVATPWICAKLSVPMLPRHDWSFKNVGLSEGLNVVSSCVLVIATAVPCVASGAMPMNCLVDA